MSANSTNSSNAPVIEAKRSGVYRAPTSVVHLREQAKKSAWCGSICH